MSCRICGRGACTESFHSIEEQEKDEEIITRTEDRMRNNLTNRINKIEGQHINEVYWVQYEDVLNEIQNY